MRVALLVADVIAGFGLVLLVAAGARATPPFGVVLAIVMSGIGLVLGVGLRFVIGRRAAAARAVRRS